MTFVVRESIGGKEINISICIVSSSEKEFSYLFYTQDSLIVEVNVAAKDPRQ